MGEMDIVDVDAVTDGGTVAEAESEAPRENGHDSDASGGVISASFAEVEMAEPLAGGVLDRWPPLVVFGAGAGVGALVTTLVTLALLYL